MSDEVVEAVLPEGEVPPILTVTEVAKLLRVSKYTVYGLTRSRLLPSMLVGGRLVVARADLDRYLSSLRRE